MCGDIMWTGLRRRRLMLWTPAYSSEHQPSERGQQEYRSGRSIAMRSNDLASEAAWLVAQCVESAVMRTARLSDAVLRCFGLRRGRRGGTQRCDRMWRHVASSPCVLSSRKVQSPYSLCVCVCVCLFVCVCSLQQDSNNDSSFCVTVVRSCAVGMQVCRGSAWGKCKHVQAHRVIILLVGHGAAGLLAALNLSLQGWELKSWRTRPCSSGNQLML